MLISSLIIAEVDKLIVDNQCKLHKISSINILRFFWLPFSMLNFTVFKRGNPKGRFIHPFRAAWTFL